MSSPSMKTRSSASIAWPIASRTASAYVISRVFVMSSFSSGACKGGVDRVEQVGRIGVGRGVGLADSAAHVLQGTGADVLDLLVGEQPGLAHLRLEAQDRVHPAPLGDLLLGAVEILVGLAVALPAVGD